MEEPADDTATVMMRGLVSVLEKHHGVRVLDEAVEAAVKLSSRYISGRQLPDKSVDVLDTAAARVEQYVTERSITELRIAVRASSSSRQVVDRQAGQCADDRAGRLEPEREDADRGSRARDASSVVADRLGRAIRSSSAIVSTIAGTVTSVLTAARAANGPAPRRSVEAGARAVGVALLLAQLHVQARVERARRGSRSSPDSGVEVRDPARQADGGRSGSRSGRSPAGG